MRATKQNYLAILRVELDDLSTDIEHLIDQCSHGRESGDISENVFLQNLATFKNELLGVHSFQKILDQIEPAAYPSLEEMIEDIRERFESLEKSHGIVHALQIYVNRKLDKVLRYVTQ
ncbi:MAG: hypothetical protein EHM72_07750 [Calditrichaeota bacterium]|nr:MAG: hypothetical protein EHM72_07750 [Calditrichota bacterium]